MAIQGLLNPKPERPISSGYKGNLAMVPGHNQGASHPTQGQFLSDSRLRLVLVAQRGVVKQALCCDPDGGLSMTTRPVDEFIVRHTFASAAHEFLSLYHDTIS
jgi:hypothetical protein